MTVFVPNDDFAAELDTEMASLFDGKAAEAEPVAQAVMRGLGGSGASAETYHAEGNRLYTDDQAGHIFEFGSVNSPPFAPLRKAAEAVGATYVDTGPE